MSQRCSQSKFTATPLHLKETLMPHLYELTACQAADLIRRKELGVLELLDSCLSRIEALEPEINAWKFLAPELARARARELDCVEPVGPLHGIPIGIKDVIDTADMPSGYGSPIYEHHRPVADAACVTLARRAGAVMVGKTITTEFACGSTARTSNPWNINHTSGGSSSGSCAAVAADMVPVSFGSQSASSTIRPASYCGLVGMRPSMGTISVAGFKYFNGSFDTIGLLARDVDDVALLWSTQMSVPVIRSDPARMRKILVCYPTWMEGYEPSARAAVEHAATVMAAAGARIESLELPPEYSDLPELHHEIQCFETSRSYAHEYETAAARLDWRVRETIEAGMKIGGDRYIEMLKRAQRLRHELQSVIGDADAVLTNAAPGEAPLNWRVMGDQFSMGDTRQSRPWTLLHVPAITVPAYIGPQGLPVGIQLLSTFGSDGTLLDIARWAENQLKPDLAEARVSMRAALLKVQGECDARL
jgi:Asp-tRNA(Asn)/Glu-tRNA(Gln) amidotransferase A subunit family amidase